MLIRRKIMQYNDMSKEELLALKESLNKEYAEAKAKGLALDMSRGKPSAKQLDVSLGLLDTINSSSDLKALDGTDGWYSGSQKTDGRYDGNNTRSCYCVWKRKS